MHINAGPEEPHAEHSHEGETPSKTNNVQRNFIRYQEVNIRSHAESLQKKFYHSIDETMITWQKQI